MQSHVGTCNVLKWLIVLHICEHSAYALAQKMYCHHLYYRQPNVSTLALVPQQTETWYLSSCGAYRTTLLAIWTPQNRYIGTNLAGAYISIPRCISVAMPVDITRSLWQQGCCITQGKGFENTALVN